VLLVALLAARATRESETWWLVLLEPFYRVGSLVWGGGPVVIPMLINDLVPKVRVRPSVRPREIALSALSPLPSCRAPSQVVSDAQFLQGFALVQAMPGPNFSVSAFLGGVYAGPAGALVAWVGM